MFAPCVACTVRNLSAWFPYLYNTDDGPECHNNILTMKKRCWGEGGGDLRLMWSHLPLEISEFICRTFQEAEPIVDRTERM